MSLKQFTINRFKHWTPRYIFDRIHMAYYAQKHKDAPWLTPMAICILETYLMPTDYGFECGSGRSTPWLAKRLGSLTSIEHNPKWANQVEKGIQRLGLNNVLLKMIPREVGDSDGSQSAYVNEIKLLEDESLDFCLVDGVYRGYCALAAIPKVKPGGLLVIDNVNWYLPHQTRSPNSVGLGDPNGKDWMEAYQTLKDWRYIWTSSGVTDTALFFKPS